MKKQGASELIVPDDQTWNARTDKLAGPTHHPGPVRRGRSGNPAQGILTALLVFAVLSVLTGLAYPLVITGIAQVLFPAQARGSLLVDVRGEVRGSALLGQDFDQPGWFHSRPSATGYAAGNSGASNLAMTSQKLADQLEARRLTWTREEGGQALPPDMEYASGSGLDPDISIQAALAQVDRVVRERHLDSQAGKDLEHLVRDLATGRGPGLEDTVNATVLNFRMDQNPGFAFSTGKAAP